MRGFLTFLLVGVLALVAIPASATPDRLLINGDVTWSKTTLTLNGSSQTLVAASKTRKGLIVYNRSTNATVTIDISGGNATAGLPVAAGQFIMFTGQLGPNNAVTILGTNTQIVDVWTGQ